MKDPAGPKRAGRSANGAAEGLAELALLARKSVARRIAPRAVKPRASAVEASGGVFPIDGSPKGLPKDSGILALVDGESLIVRIVSPEERAALKAQLQQRAPELTAGEAEVLRRGGASDAELRMGSALWALARGSSEARYQALLDDSVDVRQAATRLGVTPGRVRQLLGTQRLYGIKAGTDWRIPSFQFRGKGLVPGIDEVFAALRPELGLLAVYNWFTTRNADLRTADDEAEALTPLAWLGSGHPPKAAAALAAGL